MLDLPMKEERQKEREREKGGREGPDLFARGSIDPDENSDLYRVAQ